VAFQERIMYMELVNANIYYTLLTSKQGISTSDNICTVFNVWDKAGRLRLVKICWWDKLCLKIISFLFLQVSIHSHVAVAVSQVNFFVLNFFFGFHPLLI
jgi:hypothetical protein